MRAVPHRGPTGPADELYRVPLSDFVAKRNAIAARLRDEGNVAAAKAVTAITKPKATVWAINHVARTSPKAVKHILTAFDARAQLAMSLDAPEALGGTERMTS